MKSIMSGSRSIQSLMKLSFLCISISFLAMCNQIESDLVVQMDASINQVLVDYNQKLGSDDIHVNYKAPGKYDSLKRVHVILFNPKHLPDSISVQANVSLSLAKEVYKCLQNKNDFEKIDVEFVYEIPHYCNPHYNIAFDYTYKELGRVCP